jgi:16S rRNA (guanine527-N7)-methyltransferase
MPEISPEVETRLRELLDEVLRVNQQFNLTAIRDPEEAWTKHVLDSLQGLNTGLFEGQKKVADIGTGPGFPGLPLAIARPQLRLILVESVRKKCDFLQSAVEKFNLNAKVVCERAEATGQDKMRRARFDVVTARAVGSIGEICELVLPLVRLGGHAVLWRGQWANEELKAARGVIKTLGAKAIATTPYQLPGHLLNYHLLVLEKVAPTPQAFPRREGLPKHQPMVTFHAPQRESDG